MVNRFLAVPLILLLTTLFLGGCASGNEEELAALEERIKGLERETASLDENLKAANRERNRTRSQLQAVRRELMLRRITSSDDIDFDEMCGTPPGDGAFGYTRVTGIACETGEAIARGAIEDFCRERNGCRLSNEASAPYVGEIEFQGWACQVETGWEISRTACVKGDAVIVSESGA